RRRWGELAPGDGARGAAPHRGGFRRRAAWLGGGPRREHPRDLRRRRDVDEAVLAPLRARAAPRRPVPRCSARHRGRRIRSVLRDGRRRPHLGRAQDHSRGPAPQRDRAPAPERLAGRADRAAAPPHRGRGGNAAPLHRRLRALDERGFAVQGLALRRGGRRRRIRHRLRPAREDLPQRRWRPHLGRGRRCVARDAHGRDAASGRRDRARGRGGNGAREPRPGPYVRAGRELRERAPLLLGAGRPARRDSRLRRGGRARAPAPAHAAGGRAMRLERFIGAVSRIIFGHRRAWLTLFALLTALFAFSASRLAVDAGFNKMVPLQHPYMKVYREYENVFGSANRIAIALMQDHGDIYTRQYMAKLKALTNDVFLLNGVDRASVKSLFTPNTRFIEVIEEGFAGGNVVPATFQGTDQDLATVRANVDKSTEVGRTVATDFSGALVTATLLEIDPQTGKRLDYFDFARKLEDLRGKYQGGGQTVAIIGFAKAVGDIAEGAKSVILFFAIAFLITFGLMLWFVKDFKLALVALVVALMPVLWLLGTLPILHFGIDPLSILVPFLIFSIGVSHAVQMAKTWEREVLAGADSLAAARTAF